MAIWLWLAKMDRPLSENEYHDMLELLPNDRVKRISDGKVFRITSDARDMTTPEQSDMHFREADAEVVTA